MPMFDIKLELSKEGIKFEPEIEENDLKGATVRNVVKGWINDFFSIAGSI